MGSVAKEHQERDADIGHAVQLTVRGLDCPDCAATLERAIGNLPSVDSARLIYSTGQLIVESGDGANLRPAIERLVRQMGYEVEPQSARPRGWLGRLAENRLLLGMSATGLFMALAFIAQMLGAHPLVRSALLMLAVVAGGIHFAQAAFVAISKTHRLDMNVLMVTAAIGALVIGEPEEAAVTVFLLSLGELLEEYASDRARRAISALMAIAPDRATVLRDGQPVTVAVEELAVGDLVQVQPGERLPADGRLLEGHSEINQAPITGESVPVEKSPGDEVYAGTLNGSGALLVEVTRPAQDSTISRIMRLVEEAQSQRAGVERWVDRFAAVYTPVVFGIAVVVALLPPVLGLGAATTWVYRSLVLLLIACPCALVISTPVTMVSALARATRSGVLIKGGRYLEALASAKVFAFDKTGTLTLGEPYVVGGNCQVHADPRSQCQTCSALLAKAAALEQRSEHALARAVTREAERQGLLYVHDHGEDVVAHAGMGIEGRVGGHQVTAGNLAFSRRNGHEGEEGDRLFTEAEEAEKQGYTVVVIEDTCCGQRCYLTIADQVRPEAEAMVAQLKELGIERVVMLTGDNPHIARLIAEHIGVDEYYAGLLPEDKVQVVRRLVEQYGSVAMVGDGVNDAPALATATVGIAMGAAGTDVALETADVALMHDDLGRIPFTVRLSRAALRTVRINVALSLGIKAVFLVLALLGVATLWMAVVADTGTSLLVSINGARMLRFRED